MKNSLRAIGSLLLGAMLVAAPVSAPVMAADVQDVKLTKSFQEIEVNTRLDTLESNYLEGLVQKTDLYSGDKVLADPDIANPTNHVYQMDGSGKTISLDTGAQYATTDFSFRVYLPDTSNKELSFAAYCNWRDAVTGKIGDNLVFSSISGLSGSFAAKNNKINGAAYTANTWHTIRYVSETTQEGSCIYKYFDNELVACVKNPYKWDAMDRKATGLNNVFLPGKSAAADLRYDDISLTMLANQPQVALSIEGEKASGEYNVADIVAAITAKATVTNSTTATDVVFKDGNGNVLGTAAINENGEASIGILPGQTVSAEAIVKDKSGNSHTIAASAAKTVKGFAISQQYYFYNSYDAATMAQWNENNPIYYDYYGSDGVPETRWSTLNYYASQPAYNSKACVVNQEGMYMHNANVDAATVTATGVNLSGDTQGHTIAVKMTSVQSESGGTNPKFKPWIGFGKNPNGQNTNNKTSDKGWDKFYGMSPTQYQAAGGTADNYAEKMKSVYVVMEQYYKFDDFAVGRNLLKPNWFTTTGAHSWWERYGGVSVAASDGDSAALKDCNGTVLATVKTNQWYRLTCVYDIKNGDYAVLVDGEYKGKSDFTGGGALKDPVCMSDIIEWYDGTKTADNKTSVMYMDDFKIFMTSLENNISDPAEDGSVIIKNDGMAKDISIITAAYADAECTQLAGVVVDTATFATGDLQKTVKLSWDELPSGAAAQKTFFINNIGTAMKPLRAAYTK